ncbi:glycerol-3-phosphate 1-O-acyltransferase PlsY [Ostreiculturibacter nitratireducens]|uniref:glycerol-3-phosphate 1-O-acyltransferase PlsY n=1 Tax=Ostreiculturibacter nitratireducens TaxID=3075226 RepID=UPI0031B58561
MPIFETGPAGLILTALIAYLLGSIPFGLVLTRVFNLGDLRKIGSGNIGATNVLRTGNKAAAAATLVLDAAKGAVAVLIARAAFAEDAVQLAALMALLGHCFPVWLRFKGGKGVATFLGVLLALSFPVGLAACGTWLVFALVSRISSIGALGAAASAPVWMLFLGGSRMFVLGVVMTALVILRHRTNIQRIMAGTESQIGRK